MWLLLCGVLVYTWINSIVCPPVTPAAAQGGEKVDYDTGLEYDNYLKEVVSVLEQDEEFRKKLESSNATDVKSGNIAHQLEFVSHRVREKLDELKRRELERLKDLIKKKLLLSNGTDVILAILQGGIEKLEEPGHVNVNTHGFNVDDLKKLIAKTTNDLEEMDKKRREKFKEYEMQKEHERRMDMEKLSEEEKVKAQAEHDAQVKKHKDHPKLHHPGSKAQLEEVWEEDDHLDKNDFDPKTFFKLHDLNNDGMWFEDEVRALFQKELDKVYDEDASEDDLVERYEEMNRMREHLVNEVDVNKDQAISFDEYMNYVNGQNFDKDEGWETLDEEPQYTEEELAEYEKLMEEERGKLGDMYDGHAQPGEINIPAHHEQPGVVQMEQKHANLQAQPGMQDQEAQMRQQAQLHEQQQMEQRRQQVNLHQQQQQQQQQINQQQQQQQINQHQQPQQAQHIPQGQNQLNVQQAQVQQGQINPGQGQIPQGAVEGQVPQGQVQGQVPQVQGQVPQGQVQGQVPQGQVPQGQVGQVPQGQVPVVNPV